MRGGDKCLAWVRRPRQPFRFIQRNDIAVEYLLMNVTRQIATVLGKIAVYVADATAQTAMLILRTGVFDVSAVGLKEGASAQNTCPGITY